MLLRYGPRYPGRTAPERERTLRDEYGWVKKKKSVKKSMCSKEDNTGKIPVKEA
jgi:hypothetical protein